jgi:hypothetical protein
MQVGIDSFAAFDDVGMSASSSERLRRLVEQIEYADKIGLDVFGIGEHRRREFLISPEEQSFIANINDNSENYDIVIERLERVGQEPLMIL